jgi:hypothetical protein
MAREKIEVMINGKTQGIWDGTTSNCGRPGKPGCGAEIGFAKMASGKMLPFNVEDFTAHFGTCPVRGNFRKED